MAVERLTGESHASRLEFEEIRGFEGVKEAAVQVEDATIRVAVVSGLGNVEPIVRRILAGEDVGYDLIEVMACPGGCICGAGHPVPEKVGESERRRQVLLDIDRTSGVRRSQDNPDVLQLYRTYIGEPDADAAHHMLHTTYRARSVSSADHRTAMGSHTAATDHYELSELAICVCDTCVRNGSDALYRNLSGLVMRLRLDNSLHVRTIRLRGAHESGIHITLNRRRIPESVIGEVFRGLAGDAGHGIRIEED
jgi:hypothetical protein